MKSRATTAAAKDRHAYHHGDLRRALVEEAARLVQRSGHAELSLREVARRAGVTHAAAYHHFATREVLLAATAAEGFRRLQQALIKSTENVTFPLDVHMRLGRAYVAYAMAHAPMYRLMFSAEAADRDALPELKQAAEATFGLLVASTQRCQDAGLVRSGDPVELALSAWVTVHGLSSLIVDRQLHGAGLDGRPIEELIASVMGSFFTGTRPQ